MRYLRYRLYCWSSGVRRRVMTWVTPFGRHFLLFALLMSLFGLNTRQTMMYQLASIAVVAALIAIPFALFFSTSLRLRRFFPQTCAVGEGFAYSVEVYNPGPRKVQGVFYREQVSPELPSFQRFTHFSDSPGGRHHFIDRLFGYRRWLHLVQLTIGFTDEPFPLPSLPAGGSRQVETRIMPLRRGYILLPGYVLFSVDPLGIFKKEIYFREPERVLVLPKRYPVIAAALPGSRKYHQGGAGATAGSGDTGEFVGLREYRPGDAVRQIDWKATARTRSTIVRQLEEEYFPRIALVIDTFCNEGAEQLFEDVLSIGASIMSEQDLSHHLVDLYLAAEAGVAHLAAGRGLPERYPMVEALACAAPCTNGSFQRMSDAVLEHADLLSGAIVVLLDIDECRTRLVAQLELAKVECRVIVVTKDEQQTLKRLAASSLTEAKCFPVDTPTKQVDLR